MRHEAGRRWGMKAAWETLIQRADVLRQQGGEAAALLTFYACLLGAQRQAYDSFCGRQGWMPAGELAQDLAAIRPAFGPLLSAVAANGPPLLADEARHLQEAGGD